MSSDKITELPAEEPKVNAVEESEIPAGANVSIHSRGEKKARALIEKLNLKKVAGVTRVVFRRTGGAVFAITNPDVYKNPGTGTYVIFGEAQVDTQTQNLAQQLAALSGEANAGESAAAKDPVTADLEAAVKKASIQDTKDEEPEIPDSEVDTTGLEESDIQIIIDQANISKAKAVAALRKNNGDLVNTIMELTT